MNNWDGYDFSDADKARLAYIAQQLLGTQYGQGMDRFADYHNPIDGRIDKTYGAQYATMNNDTINQTIEALRRRYQPAIYARQQFGDMPRSFRDFYGEMFR